MVGVLERMNQAATGPSCSLFAEAQRYDRRSNTERRRIRPALQGAGQRRQDRRCYGTAAEPAAYARRPDQGFWDVGPDLISA